MGFPSPLPEGRGAHNQLWLQARRRQMGVPAVSTTRDAEAVAAIRDDAIRRANELNGNVVRAGTTESLFEQYFEWQDALPRDSELRKAQGTLDENRREANVLQPSSARFGPQPSSHRTSTGTWPTERRRERRPRRTRKSPSCLLCSNTGVVKAIWKRIHAAASSTTRPGQRTGSLQMPRSRSCGMWHASGAAVTTSWRYVPGPLS